jgi:hypothetical protein
MMRDIRSFGTRRIVPASALRKSRKQNKTKNSYQHSTTIPKEEEQQKQQQHVV